MSAIGAYAFSLRSRPRWHSAPQVGRPLLYPRTAVPEADLCLAVLCQALSDATDRPPRCGRTATEAHAARAWLLGESASLQLVCECLGISREALAHGLRQRQGAQAWE